MRDDILERRDWNRIDAKTDKLREIHERLAKLRAKHNRLVSSKAYLDRESQVAQKARRIEQQMFALDTKRDLLENKLRGLFI